MPHKWEYFHNMLGYNYRLPNLNASLLCAQLNRVDEIKKKKKVSSNQSFQYIDLDLSEDDLP